MSQSYVKECTFCKQKIKMSDHRGRWLPFNPDGKIHECKEKIVNDSVPAISNGNGNDISLEVFLKKLQSIGITIDINKLRNCEINNNANK
jgi:hypothetical protein